MARLIICFLCAVPTVFILEENSQIFEMFDLANEIAIFMPEDTSKTLGRPKF